MRENDALAERFEANRAHLRTVAYRMLGSLSEADDAVQEAWLRLSRSDTSSVDNLRGWLTTVVARVCLDMLRSRKSRREDSLGAADDQPIASPEENGDPEHEAMVADSVGLAMLVVLETLTPAERVAFVLHDMFDLPFDEIAPIVGRSPTAARQLASRARRRVRGADSARGAHRSRQREVVEAFLAAARGGDFARLLSVLDPDVVLRADAAMVLASATRQAGDAPELKPETRGATAVAETFLGRAAAAQPALVNGMRGLAWTRGGQPRAVMQFTFAKGRIVAIYLRGDAERIRELDVRIVGDGG